MCELERTDRCGPIALYAVLALVIGAPDGDAATIRVPTEALTIQAGIDAATEDDTVLVAPGIYTGDGNHSIDFSPPPADSAKNVVVLSEAGPEFTIIDIQGNSDDPRRGFIFNTGEGPTSIVEGFTLRNGFMSTLPSRGAQRHEVSGGGIAVRGIDTSPVIRSCIFENNHSAISGGGIEAELRAAPTIEDCVFVGNSSGAGGAISLETNSAATIRNCVITGNLAQVCGGGIFFASSALVEGTVIGGNRADEGGGVDSSFPAQPTLRNVIVWNNCADVVGPNAHAQEFAALAFECSAVDTAGSSPGGDVTFDTECIFLDPLFCMPAGCLDAPETGGDYHLDEASPCLPGASGCGLMGALGAGCMAKPVQRASWAAIKDRFRR